MSESTSRLAAALADRYTLERRLGEGGMATVYLAEDLKHKRQVAVKVLRPELAAVLGADRFVQEITTTASLQHPNILALFDSGEADGFLYYVMPYVEGETLREKLNRETQLGIDEAVKIATDVAEALQAAHEEGVIHRDIKPENVLLHKGRAIVADFGIALAVSAAAGGRMTETGLSLGTPHYMSPEQATAEKDISARSDVYSLGSVLYEMLAGHPPHVGASAQQIILKIVTEEALPVTSVRKSVPEHVAAALAVALEKLPADRFASATAFAEALRGTVPVTRGIAATPHRSAVGRWPWLGWGVAALGLAVAAWALLNAGGERRRAPVVRHLNIVLPDSAPLAFIGEGTLGAGRRALTLSPDGQTLVYAARETTGDRLYRRDLSDFTATPIPGTDGAYSPFFSPDGQWVGFFVGAELYKVPVAGGPSVRLASVPEPMGAAWGPNGMILVTIREGLQIGWVPESGGSIRELPDARGASLARPSLLPDGRHALVELWVPPLLSGALGVADLETGRTAALTAAGPVAVDSVDHAAAIFGVQPHYAGSGHLLYATRSGLVAVAFDPVTHRVGGRAVEVLSGVRRETGGAQYAVGIDGSLVYAAGADATVGSLVWATPGGRTDSVGFAHQMYGTFDLSPDGRRLAATVLPSPDVWELWVYDLTRGTESKVVTQGVAALPRWWPDGRRVVFTETTTSRPYVSVSVRQLVESAGARDTLGGEWGLTGFTSDTTSAVGTRGLWGRGVQAGVWVFSLGDSASSVPVDSFRTAWGGALSPDGRWIAYTSNETGKYEVYVVAADRLGERQKASLDGGEEPVWMPDGRALVYRWGQAFYSVAVPSPGSTTFGRPAEVLRGSYINVPWRSYDIASDGRFLLVEGPREETATHLNVITDWLDEVARRVGQ